MLGGAPEDGKGTKMKEITFSPPIGELLNCRVCRPAGTFTATTLPSLSVSGIQIIMRPSHAVREVKLPEIIGGLGRCAIAAGQKVQKLRTRTLPAGDACIHLIIARVARDSLV